MSNNGTDTNPGRRKINLRENVQLCLNLGFGTLITANNDENYRNAIISIHNGLELLMKYYLRKKDRLLILQKINYHFLLSERTDLIKNVNSGKAKANTISYNDCIKILEHFSHLPNDYTAYLKQLNDQRNDCVHYQYSYNQKELRKLLIFHIYQFICELILEMELEPKEFILEKYTSSLDKLKETIDDEIKHSYYEKIEAAKKHYFEELTEPERKEKVETEDYTKRKIDIIVKCPACRNNALLRKKIQHTIEEFVHYARIKQDLILKDLSCHYCGLSITDYDLLKLDFKDEERSLREIISYNDCPDDCPPEDCPDYEDCPDDCPPEDCPDYEDCPDDCPPEDCPDYEDCPDDCPPEDCPDYEDCTRG